MNRNWRHLELSEVIAVHEYLLDLFGGSEGVRDVNLLESALAQPRQTFDGKDLYRTPAEKAARYAFGIVNNHPFVDGNKRTGAACLGMALRGNDVRFKPRSDDLCRTIIAIADGSLSYEELVIWVESVIG